MMKFKVAGLVADLIPNIRLIQGSGHFMLNYHADNSGALHTLRLGYCCMTLVFMLFQYSCNFVNLVLERGDVNDLAANTITVLFFTHCITKFVYFAVRSRLFYRTLGIWNQPNSHPLFVESNNRYHALALKKMRRLLYIIIVWTSFSAISWTSITFVGDSVHNIKDPENENETITVPIPRLLVRSWYPWDAMSGLPHLLTLVFQVYYVLFSIAHANLLDSLFCSWLIFACEQLQHLKEIMKPLMELSATLDTYVPKSADLFRAPSATSQDNLIENEYNTKNEDLKGVYSTRQELGGHFRGGALQNFGGGGGGVGPNGLTKKQELMVRSAIKYWVERHKHVVRLVTAIGDAYGVALLLHMLTSTIMLTLLAYQATKITGVDKYAATVLGYLLFALGQVFHFCIFGNRLIEESSSVMEAAYSCHWYDGSEEAKTFVQIVCQQCQKAMSISGAKFFTISLDLFASVLGAVVTYFMVLVQLKIDTPQLAWILHRSAILLLRSYAGVPGEYGPAHVGLAERPCLLLINCVQKFAQAIISSNILSISLVLTIGSPGGQKKELYKWKGILGKVAAETGSSDAAAITPNSKRNLELDLDFLERRQNESSSENPEAPRSPIEISPESVDRVKVILLGAPAVGKTSIIQQFVWNDFCEEYIPTDRKHTYYPSVITNERLYEIKISDLPVIPYFPVNSYYEWANYRYYGLRSASAYILVFDLSNLETFQYVRTLREQICESRNMSNVPLLVVGNKQDLTAEEGGAAKVGLGTGAHDDRRRDIANLVKKHWKCGYIECSAKYNWKVVAVFRELINMIDSLDSRDQSPMLDNIQDALDRNKCVVI